VFLRNVKYVIEDKLYDDISKIPEETITVFCQFLVFMLTFIKKQCTLFSFKQKHMLG